MPSDVSALYGKSYQRDSVSPEALKAWDEISEVLISHFPYPEWCDVGCGGGGLLKFLGEKGKRGWGIEGSSFAQGLLPDVEIVEWDLRTPFPCEGRGADVVTCFDVGEHVGAAEVLSDTLTGLARSWLLFGAAPPGQDGLGHIDCRPYEDWTHLFKARGFKHVPLLTEGVKAGIRSRKKANFIWWVEKNLHVYTRA